MTNKAYIPQLATFHQQITRITTEVGRVIVGKEKEVQLVLTCLLARGHVLIEDVPGVGKTTLAHVLAKVLGLSFQRVQFTSDLLPADIIGVSVFEQDTAQFKFHPGPIFAQMVLADEVNRATPKTQSALLEAMEEQQVTVEGQTRQLPTPFFVLATQNPLHQIGTFPLPESQLDRFMMRITLGYPDHTTERALLMGENRRDLIHALNAAATIEEITTLQNSVKAVHVSEALLDYLQAILEYSRHSQHFRVGLSPRAGLSILNSTKAWALVQGRDYVLPDDIQAILPTVVSHRLAAMMEHQDSKTLVKQLLEEVAIP